MLFDQYEQINAISNAFSRSHSQGVYHEMEHGPGPNIIPFHYTSNVIKFTHLRLSFAAAAECNRFELILLRFFSTLSLFPPPPHHVGGCRRFSLVSNFCSLFALIPRRYGQVCIYSTLNKCAFTHQI